MYDRANNAAHARKMNAIRPAINPMFGFDPWNRRKITYSVAAPAPKTSVPAMRTTISAR